MPRAFDPAAISARLLDGALDRDLAHLRECVTTMPSNWMRWSSGMSSVAQAAMVGLGDDARVREMLEIVLAMLAEDRLAAVKPHDSNATYNLARGWQTLALGRWIQHREIDRDAFSQAYRSFLAYFEPAYAAKAKWRIDSTSTLVALGCLGDLYDEVAAIFARPQMAAYRAIEPAKVRTMVDLASVVVRHHARDGTIDDDAAVVASERMIRHQIAAALERGGYEDAALVACFGGIGLARVREYVSYLVPKPAKPAKAAASKKAAAPASAPPSTPLPAIIASSSMHASRETWIRAGDGWALRVGAASVTTNPRFRDVVELHTLRYELVIAPEVQRLTRATLDGHMLSKLALRETPSTIQVAFPRHILGNAIDGGWIQVSPPLSRGIWRNALAVGALTSLRALSFDAKESEKQRIARGAEAYQVAPAWFWESPLAQQLEALDVEADVHSLGEWCTRFRELPRLERVYLRMWAACSGAYNRPLRIVLERDGAAVRLIFQAMLPLDDYADATFATLFAGTSTSDFTTASFESLGALTGTLDKLGAYARTGDLVAEAALREL